MTSISKNVYIDKLDEIENEYNNTYHRTIEIKHIDVKDNIHILILVNKLMIKMLNLKLVIYMIIKNTKIFFLKVILQIGLKKFL